LNLKQEDAGSDDVPDGDKNKEKVTGEDKNT
jgi:hypothetical protein